MNVELKISVPLAKLSALAAALIATLGADGAAAALGATITTAADAPAAPTPATAEVKPGKGKSKSAAPAVEPATADSKAAASAQASDTAAQQPSPSTGETSQPTADTKSDAEAELPVYEKMDLGPRIVAVSEAGNAEHIAAVKKLLGEYQHNGFADKKASSGRHLRREDLNDFNKRFTALEASFKAADDEAMG